MSVLFDRLLDDAAIFPPGNAPMDEAVRAHVAALDSPVARHVGPFVCSAARLGELDAALLSAGIDQIDLALVTPSAAAGAAVAAAHDDTHVRLRIVEVAAGGVDDSWPEAPSGARIVVEGAPDPTALPTDVGVKIRTGGEQASAFPDEAQLAAALHAAVADDRQLKLTAGLHHAVRNSDAATGFEQHGFLNVMLAVHAAIGGADGHDLASVLAERDGSVVARGIAELDADACRRIRSTFLSFGTCSLSEPLDDLHALGLLERVA